MYRVYNAAVKTPPSFSIVIPALNEEKYIHYLLKDLVAQTFTNFETIVVDASSTDKTVAKAKLFTKTLHPHIQSNTARNVSTQRNLGAAMARGQWIIFMDADNRIPKHFLQGIRYQLDKHPKTDVFSCWIDPDAYSTADKPLIQLANIGVELATKVKPQSPGALIGAQRKVLKKVKFDESLTLSEDHEFLSDVVKKGFSFTIFRDPQYVYSLRRLKHEGRLKMLRVFAQAQMMYLTGQKITKAQAFYPMNGGATHTLSPKKLSLFERMVVSFNSISSTQLKQAKKMLNLFKELTSLDYE